MAFQYFGQWLLHKKIIKAEQLLKAIDMQINSNFSLGDLAIDKGYLKPLEAEKINIEQQSTDRRFGEIAIDQGHLSGEQLEDLLREQKARHIYLGEALVKLGFLEQDTLDKELSLHRNAQQEHEALLSVSFDSLPHQDITKTLLDLTIKLFARIVHENLQVSDIVTDYPPQTDLYHFRQHISGDTPTDFILSLPAALIIKIAAKLLKQDQQSLDQACLDVTLDFLNIISGNARIKAGSLGLQLELEAPQILESLPETAENNQRASLRLSTPEDDIFFHLLF